MLSSQQSREKNRSRFR